MPTVSIFFGIVILMFYDEHNPPHFHARYAEALAQISIETGEVVEGDLPKTARRLVRQWTATHRTALMENWELCRKELPLRRIPPLT